MIIKKGRNPTTDYDLLIYVKSDNSLWVTPSNPVELYGEDYRGYNWHDDRVIGKNITKPDDTGLQSWPALPENSDVNDVARCIKPINPEYELRWSGLDWSEASGGALENAVFAKLTFTNGTITINGALPAIPPSDLSPNNIVHAKLLFPEYAWIIYNEEGTEFLVINPYNPRGNGLVPGGSGEEYSFPGSGTGTGTGAGTIFNGPLIFDSYAEFKLWYENPDDTYEWLSSIGIDKNGRVIEEDYDRMIFIIEDSQWWRCPSNPTESGDSLGSGWGSGWGSGSPTNRDDVPTEFKPINLDFNVNWKDENFDWETGSNDSSITTYWRKILWNGKIPVIDIATELEPTSITDAKSKFPTHSWVVLSTESSNPSFRLINPYNINGNGNIPGPSLNDITYKKFLRSDGKWDNIQQDVSFNISNLQIGDIGEKLISNLSIFNTISIAVDIPANDDAILKFELYQKSFNEIDNYWDESLICTVEMPSNNGKESYLKTTNFDITFFDREDILLIKCTDIGLSDIGISSSSSSLSEYNGNVKITVYYSET